MNKEEIAKYSSAFLRDFDNYLQEGYQNEITHLSAFYNFPFEIQLGVFIKFLQENTVELEFYNTSIENLKHSVIEGMKTYQNIAGHYS